MSSENVNSNSKISVTSLLAFPAVTTTIGAIGSVRRNGGVKNAIKACEIENFKGLSKALEPIHKDVFSRSIALSQNYEKYKDLSKTAAKAAKKAAKASPRHARLFRLPQPAVQFLRASGKSQPLLRAWHVRPCQHRRIPSKR